MLRMIEDIDLSKFEKRSWVYTSGDVVSIEKARTYESKNLYRHKYQFYEVPRARKVGEGLFSTVKSSLISARFCFNVLLSHPDLVSSYSDILFTIY